MQKNSFKLSALRTCTESRCKWWNLNIKDVGRLKQLRVHCFKMTSEHFTCNMNMLKLNAMHPCGDDLLLRTTLLGQETSLLKNWKLNLWPLYNWNEGKGYGRSPKRKVGEITYGWVRYSSQSDMYERRRRNKENKHYRLLKWWELLVVDMEKIHLSWTSMFLGMEI